MSYLGKRKLATAIASLLLFVLIIPGCNSYYVKVVDQNGNPIDGAKIVYSTLDGNAYFSGRDGHHATSNKNGMIKMVLGGSNEFWELTKPGYQFDLTRQMSWRFGVLYKGDLKQYSEKNPLIIYGWKRGEEPNLVTSTGAIYGFSEGETCTITLIKSSKYNQLDQDITLKYVIDGEWEKITDDKLLEINPAQQHKLKSWRATLEIPGAGIKQTEDVFMHRADEEGYEGNAFFGPEYRRGHIHYFIRGNNGEYYGGAIIEARHPLPGSAAKLTDIDMKRGSVSAEFWFNLEGSPNIMRPENADWFARSFPLGSSRFRCEESSAQSD